MDKSLKHYRIAGSFWAHPKPVSEDDMEFQTPKIVATSWARVGDKNLYTVWGEIPEGTPDVDAMMEGIAGWMDTFSLKAGIIEGSAMASTDDYMSLLIWDHRYNVWAAQEHYHRDLSVDVETPNSAAGADLSSVLKELGKMGIVVVGAELPASDIKLHDKVTRGKRTGAVVESRTDNGHKLSRVVWDDGDADGEWCTDDTLTAS